MELKGVIKSGVEKRYEEEFPRSLIDSLTDIIIIRGTATKSPIQSPISNNSLDGQIGMSPSIP